MIHGKKIIVVLPAYNAVKTLEMTYNEIPLDIVDDIILVDDASHDETVSVARNLGLDVIIHPQNRGYGANQKTCYRESLKRNADIIIMLHPDYQYPPRLITPMASMIASCEFDVVLGSRILGGMAIKGGMPIYKYVSNRILTLIENILLNQKISEYHTGYRAFRREVLERLPIEENSDDFVFDSQMIAQAIYFGFRVGEITSPTRYFEDASSINFKRSVVYGLGVLATSAKYRLSKLGFGQFKIFNPDGRRLQI
jgi:glycosyltransferase involved in cell wall biosynthesis